MGSCTSIVLVTACIASFTIGIASPAHAGPAEPTPRLTAQPDGTTFWRVLRGDEHDSHFETGDGYTIVEIDGTWVYAELDADGHLAATPHVVGTFDPWLAGLPPHLSRLDPPVAPSRGPPPLLIAPDAVAPMQAPSLGHAMHLVVLASFADHWDYSAQTVRAGYGFAADRYAALMNEPGHAWDGAQGSLADYFAEASNGQLTVASIVPAWVRLPDVEARYANADGAGRDDGGRLMRDALAALAAQGFDFAATDGDGDGWVDMLTIIHSGWDAADGGNGQASFVWSHASAVAPVTYDGVRAGRYTTIAALRGVAGNVQITRIGTACHELGHFLGIRDYYDTDGATGGDGQGLGNWSIMAGGGWLGGGARPGPFDAYTRSLLGWVVPRRVHALHAGSGYVFPLDPSAGTTEGVLRIDDGYRDGEYLLVEHLGDFGNFARYSAADGLAQGLAVWHIDERRDDNNTSATPTLLRARLVEADGDESLSSPSGARSEPGDVWDPARGEVRIDGGNGAGGVRSNDGYDAGVSIDIGGTAGDVLTVSPTTRVPWLHATEGLVGVAEPVSLVWGEASGASGYVIERGRMEARSSYRDDAEDRERWLGDWHARGSWQRMDHRGKNIGGAADGAMSYAAVATAWSSDESATLAPSVSWREGHFILTFQQPVWVTSQTIIRWQEKRIHKDGSSFHRLQVRPWEGGVWQTVYRKDDSWALWWSGESVDAGALAAFVDSWVQLRFEVVVEAFASDFLWPHSGVAIDRFELDGVVIYQPVWSELARVGADTTTLAPVIAAEAGDWLVRVRALRSGGVPDAAASNSVAVTTSTAVDRIAPSRIADLRVTSTTSDVVTLAFTACGDDGASGSATIEVRRSSQVPTDQSFAQGALVPVDGAPAGGQAATARASGLGPRTTWFFAARCRDAAGNVGALSNTVGATTTNPAPSAPSLLTPADGATHVGLDAALSWHNGERTGDPVSPTWYSVVVHLSPSRATVEAGGAAVLVTDSLTTSVLPTLLPDTTYYWRVVNANATGTSASPIASFTTRGGDGVAPATIGDLHVDQLSGVSVLLLWTAPGDDGMSGTASRYDLRVARAPLDVSSFAAAQPLGVPAPAPAGSEDGVYLIGLLPQTTYWVALETGDEVPNMSGLSNVVSFTTLTVAKPAAPVATSPADGAVVLAPGGALTWLNGERTAAPPDRSRAAVQLFFASDEARVEDMALGDHPDHPSALVAEGGAELTSWSPGPLAAGATYYWRVVDHNAGGATVGPVWSFRVTDGDEVAPAAVTDLRVVNVLDHEAELAWTAPGDDGDLGRAARYELRLADVAFDAATLADAEVVGDVPPPASAGTSEQWTLTGLRPRTRYWVALRAADETGRFGLATLVELTTTGPDPEPSAEPTPEASVETTPEPGPEAAPEAMGETSETSAAEQATGPSGGGSDGSDGCAGGAPALPALVVLVLLAIGRRFKPILARACS